MPGKRQPAWKTDEAAAEREGEFREEVRKGLHEPPETAEEKRKWPNGAAPDPYPGTNVI
jgi:hypothetical protein